MYDSDQSVVTDALKASNSTVFSDSTINQILALTTRDNATVRFDKVGPDVNGNVTVASGAEVVLVTSSDTFTTTVKPPANAPVVIFQGKGGVVATINDPTASVPSSSDHNVLQPKVDRIVVGTAGNDKIVVGDARNTKVILGTGDSSVTTGLGIDTVQAGLGNSSIVGGGGDYAVVKLAGNASNYQVTAQNGHAIVTDMTTHKVTDISKIQYVQLDNGKALVFAGNSLEAQVAQLYHVAFGRDADAGGLNYWFDLAKAGASLKQIASAFTHQVEFADASAKSDLLFIDGLYQNTFGRSGENAGVLYWLDALNHGATRADLIADFAQIAVQNIMHQAPQQEAQVIGQVTIVQNII